DQSRNRDDLVLRGPLGMFINVDHFQPVTAGERGIANPFDISYGVERTRSGAGYIQPVFMTVRRALHTSLAVSRDLPNLKANQHTLRIREISDNFARRLGDCSHQSGNG